MIKENIDNLEKFIINEILWLDQFLNPIGENWFNHNVKLKEEE